MTSAWRQLAPACLTVAVVLAACGAPQSAGPSPAPGGPQAAPASAGEPPRDSMLPELAELARRAVVESMAATVPGPDMDRADREATSALRELGGVARLLGSNGADILGEIDTATQRAIAAYVAAMKPEPAARGTSSPGSQGRLAIHRAGDLTGSLASVDGARLSSQSAEFAQVGSQSFRTVFSFMVTAPETLGTMPRDSGGNIPLPPPIDTTSAQGVTAQLSMKARLAGSKLSADAEAVLRAIGPPPYEERASGNIAIDLCPDEGGRVTLELTLKRGYALPGSGMQSLVTLSALGYVNDAARLERFDVTSNGSLASQATASAGGDPAAASRYVEVSLGYSASADAGGPVDVRLNVVRMSSQADRDLAQAAATITARLGYVAALAALTSAEKLWTSGYCLDVIAAGGTVSPGSTTAFGAFVHHRFEDRDLHAPVAATLAAGAVSVSPSQSPVPAPATFRYLAPGVAGASATVALETRSKRGVATSEITFTTMAWYLDTQVAGSRTTGLKCGGVGGMWAINYDYGSGIRGAAEVQIDPATGRGAYTYKQDSGGTLATHLTATGAASVVVDAAGRAHVRFEATTANVTITIPAGAYQQSQPWGPLDYVWELTAIEPANCP